MVVPQGLGSRRRLGARERQEKLRDVGGPPLPLLPDAGDPHQLSPHRGLSWPHFWVPCCMAMEEEVDTVLWCPEERVGVEAVRIEP